MQCSKNYFKISLPQEAGAFGNKVEKEPQKLIYLYILYIYSEYLLWLQSIASSSFLQKCINFKEQRLKFSHFEGSIIP